MAAGNAVVAHDNRYNRWVACDAAVYFQTAEEAGRRIGEVLGDPVRRQAMSAASRRRHAGEFTWEHVRQYEALLERYLKQK